MGTLFSAAGTLWEQANYFFWATVDATLKSYSVVLSDIAGLHARAVSTIEPLDQVLEYRHPLLSLLYAIDSGHW